MSRRILLAEGSELLQRAVLRLADEFGYEIVSAWDGEQVLPLALETSPDLIVLDVSFPDIDGRDVLRELKADARTLHIPVLIWTARLVDEVERRSVLQLGAEDCAAKIDTLALLAKVKRILLRFPEKTQRSLNS